MAKAWLQERETLAEKLQAYPVAKGLKERDTVQKMFGRKWCKI